MTTLAELQALRDEARFLELQSMAGQQPPAVPPPAAGSQELSYPDMMKESLANVVRGAFTGGPVNAGGVAFTEAYKNLGKLMDRGAYKSGGAVVDAVAPYVSPEVAGGIGVATNMGVQGLSSGLGVLGGKATIQPAMEKTGKFLMHSALKPNAKTLIKRDQMVQTMLDEGINVSRGGLHKLQGISDDVDTQVNRLIAPSQATVSISHPVAEVQKTLDTFANQVDREGDIKSILDVWGRFNQRYPNGLPIQEAQKLKTGTYRMLKNKAYGELKGAEIEAQKSIARGLKKGIEHHVPEVGPVNKRYGDIIDAMNQLENRIGAAENNNVLGMAPMTMAINPKYAGISLADKSSWLKSIVARALYNAAPIAGTGIGGGIGTIHGTSMGGEK